MQNIGYMYSLFVLIVELVDKASLTASRGKKDIMSQKVTGT